MKSSPYHSKTRSIYQPNKTQMSKIANNLFNLCKELELDDSLLKSSRCSNPVEESKTLPASHSYLERLMVEKDSNRQDILMSHNQLRLARQRRD